MQYNFEWDPVKNQLNASKHGIAFEQAAWVFKDPMALTIFDEVNSSDDEERWITLGQSSGQHLLVVVHTYRSNDGNTVTIRLISARHATKQELRHYEG